MPLKRKVQKLDCHSIQVSTYLRKKAGILNYSRAYTKDLHPGDPTVMRDSEAFRAKVDADRKRLGLS